MPYRLSFSCRRANDSSVLRQFRFAGAQDNALVLDTVRLRERESGFGKEEPLAEAFDRLLRAEYKGELAVQYRFRVHGCGKKLLLRREKGRYKSSFLNGVTLTFHDSPFDVRFEEADIRGFIREGENEYVNELDFYERPLEKSVFFRFLKV